MTMTPLNSSVDTEYIGSQTRLSSGDIQSLNKAYSCEGRIATYGGGNDQVWNISLFYNVSKLYWYFLCTSYILQLDLSQVLCFFSQGCGGTLAGTIPSSGTLQWSINAANLMHVAVIFSDWTVSIPSQIFSMCTLKQTIFNCCNSNIILVCVIKSKL